jgi:hypothetical protein
MNFGLLDILNHFAFFAPTLLSLLVVLLLCLSLGVIMLQTISLRIDPSLQLVRRQDSHRRARELRL